jgi:hypothetical protein
MSFDTSTIKNPVAYFLSDSNEGTIRKQRQDAMRTLIGATTFQDLITLYERLYSSAPITPITKAIQWRALIATFMPEGLDLPQ